MNDENTSINETTQDAKEERKQQQEQQSNVEKEVAKKVRSEAMNEVKQLARDTVKEFFHSLFKSVSASKIVMVISSAVAVFMIIGIAAFILTMPGMVQDSIYDALTSGITGIIENVITGGKDHIISTEEINTRTIKALQDLDRMGLDPVGLGFVHGVFRDNDDVIQNFRDLGVYVNSFKINGSDKTIVSEIPTACPLLSYILCSEKTYLPETYYIKTDQNKEDFYLLWGVPLNAKIHFPLDTTKYAERNDGMLVFDKTGVDDEDITIDRQNRTMTYTNTRYLNFKKYTQSYTVDLENWIGRYGKPLEFLMALHIATMTSDIPEEFATNEELQTKVEMSFQEGTYDIDFEIQIKKDDGTTEPLDIKFGEPGDTSLRKLFDDYKCIGTVYNEETGKYEYTFNNPNADDFTKDSVTICSLKDLIDNLKLVTTYNGEESQELYTGGLDTFEAAIEELLYGNDYIYVKYDANLNYGPGNYSEMGAYIGTYNEEERKGTGFLSDDGTFSFNWGNTAIPLANVSYNNSRVSGFGTDNGLAPGQSGTPVSMYIDVNSDADKNTSRDYIRIRSLERYYNSTAFNNELQRSPEVQHALTLLMLEMDQYFYDKGTDSENDDDITVKLQSQNLIINYGAAQPYVINLSNYNFLINTGSKDITNNPDIPLPGYYTKKWLEYLNSDGGIIREELKELIDSIKQDYDVTHEIDENIQKLLDELWCDIVNTDAESCPITPDNITDIYNALNYYTKGMTNIKMAYPRITTVTHHWFKDLDFTGKYDTTPTTIPAIALDDDNIIATALLTNKEHNVQTSQPYVIKGDIVTLDGEVVDEATSEKVKESNREFGKGYEASKKILTGGYYYIYDGTENTSNGIIYNKLLENVEPGNMVEVRVSSQGYIKFVKALNKTTNGTFTNDYGEQIASVSGDNLGWYVVGEKEYLENSKCTVMHFRDVERKLQKIKDKNTEVEDTEKASSQEKTEENSDNQEDEYATATETVHFYYVYIPESIQYISAAQNIDDAKKSSEKINELLIALGVNQLRKPVSFDNTISDGDDETRTSGDVATLTAFSILEGMKTDTAQTIYRDLKEFLIELGYYTKAEFEYLSSNVLEWFIPDYTPSDPEHWAQNKNEDILLYGAILYPASDYNDSDENNDGVDQEGENEQPEDEQEGETSEEQESNQEDENQDEIENSTQNGEQRENGFEPGLDVIAPGNARILEYSNKAGESYITLEFDGITQPQIAMLDRYTMTIKGITVENILVDPDDVKTDYEEDSEESKTAVGTNIDTVIAEKTIIKAKTVIGKTGTEKIQVILKNSNGAFISNVEDYMHPNLYELMQGMEYTGSLSQQFYYYLAVTEGMVYTAEEYFTHANKNVNDIGDAGGIITVGPGLLMDDSKLSKYIEKGGQHVSNRDVKSKFRKDIIMEMYIEYIDGVYKAKVEELLDGYEVSQTQMEALVLSIYQRGTGSISTIHNVIRAIKARKNRRRIESYMDRISWRLYGCTKEKIC